METIWLGQAGLLIKKGEKNILVDPYLSDSVFKLTQKNKRRVPVNTDFFQIEPDVIICTHKHLDHLDKETLAHYLNAKKSIQILCPKSAFDEIISFGENHNYIIFNRHTQWTFEDIKFTAVKAEHSDQYAIGVIIESNNQKYYITGDTLYNSEIFLDIPDDIDVLFLPINGVGNNMNMKDAKRFAKKINAKKTVPLHWGMFDDINPENFDCENKVIPKIYEEIKL